MHNPTKTNFRTEIYIQNAQYLNNQPPQMPSMDFLKLENFNYLLTKTNIKSIHNIAQQNKNVIKIELKRILLSNQINSPYILYFYYFLQFVSSSASLSSTFHRSQKKLHLLNVNLELYKETHSRRKYKCVRRFFLLLLLLVFVTVSHLMGMYNILKFILYALNKEKGVHSWIQNFQKMHSVLQKKNVTRMSFVPFSNA